MKKTMPRREFLKLGGMGLAAIALGGSLPLPDFLRRAAHAAPGPLALDIVEVLHEMVDETQVYSWAFSSADTGPRIPGPVLFAQEGDTLEIAVTNRHTSAHGFAVPGNTAGVYVVNSGAIAPGATINLSFPAPAAGTYYYEDPLNSPVNRVLGLHGALVVLPAAGSGPITCPYGSPTTGVRRLFDDLGTTAHFPGVPWDPARTNIWVFSQIDPSWNELARAGATISPAAFTAGFVPRYFTLNGVGGYFAAHDHEHIELISRVGEPRLIRNINVGMGAASPHTHANHVYLVADDGRVQDNVWWVDTWTLRPGERKDVLYPFVVPPDIPADTWERLKNGTSLEGFPENPMTPNPGFPMFYPMHCHLELSQTAAGGTYPMGLMTHITFAGTIV